MQQTPQNKVTPTTTPKMISHTSKGSMRLSLPLKLSEKCKTYCNTQDHHQHTYRLQFHSGTS